MTTFGLACARAGSGEGPLAASPKRRRAFQKTLFASSSSSPSSMGSAAYLRIAGVSMGTPSARLGEVKLQAHILVRAVAVLHGADAERTGAQAAVQRAERSAIRGDRRDSRRRPMADDVAAQCAARMVHMALRAGQVELALAVVEEAPCRARTGGGGACPSRPRSACRATDRRQRR